MRLPEKTTGEEIFRVASEYLERGGLTWENCVSVCTDGAAAMVGRTKGFVSRVKETPRCYRYVLFFFGFFFFFFASWNGGGGGGGAGTRCLDFTSRPGTCAGRCAYDKLCKGKTAKKPRICISV